MSATPTTADLDQARSQALDLVSGVSPDLDLSPGSVYRRTVIEPVAAAAAQTVADIRQLGQSLFVTQADASDEVNTGAALANLGISARAGATATGQLLLTFSVASMTLIRADQQFTALGLTFVPIATYTLVTDLSQVSDSSTDIVLTRQAAGVYTAVIDVEAQASGAASNLASGTPLTPVTPLSYLTSSVALGDLTGGADQQSTADLLSLAKSGLSRGGSMTRAGLSQILQSTFPSIQRASLVGAEDPEQIRGQNLGLGLRRSGFVDAYVAVGDAANIIQVPVTATRTVGTDATWYVHIPRETLGTVCGVPRILGNNISGVNDTGMEITSISPLAETGVVSGVDFTPYFPTDASSFNSRYQGLEIQFEDPDSLNTPLVLSQAYTAELIVMPQVAEISDWLLGADQRPQADIVVRAMFPLRVSVGLRIICYAGDEIPVQGSPLYLSICQAVVGAVRAAGFRGDPELDAGQVIYAAQQQLSGRSLVASRVGLSAQLYLPGTASPVMLYDQYSLSLSRVNDSRVSARTATWTCRVQDVSLEVENRAV